MPYWIANTLKWLRLVITETTEVVAHISPLFDWLFRHFNHHPSAPGTGQRLIFHHTFHRATDQARRLGIWDMELIDGHGFTFILLNSSCLLPRFEDYRKIPVAGFSMR